MGRDPAQITAEIEQTRAQIATRIVAIRSTDVKAKVEDARDVAVAKAKVKAQELQPVVKARAQAKVRELQPVIKARAKAKADELKTIAMHRGRDKVQELKPVVIARAREKVAELRPRLVETAKTKLEEVKPIAIARARTAAEGLKSKTRAAVTIKLEAAKDTAATSAADLGGRALATVSSKRGVGATGATLAAGVALLMARRKLRTRSQTRLQRVVAQADAVNHQAYERLQRARGRAAGGLQRGAVTPSRLRRRLRRG